MESMIEVAAARKIRCRLCGGIVKDDSAPAEGHAAGCAARRPEPDWWGRLADLEAV